jgi:hypothetical protein
MASYQKRTYGDGSKSVFAWVRIKPFKPASRSYSNQAEAKRWATELEIELRKQKKQGGARPDLTSLTPAGLIAAYLQLGAIFDLKVGRSISQISLFLLAERARFELAIGLLRCRFSRPVHSTALPPLH